MGQQSIGREANPNAPTTKRNLTLSDLLTQLKHYNASVRKDALLGLRELLDNHADIFDDSVPAVVPALARLIGDEEASVRKTLLSVLSWYLPITSPVRLRCDASHVKYLTLSKIAHPATISADPRVLYPVCTIPHISRCTNGRTEDPQLITRCDA